MFMPPPISLGRGLGDIISPLQGFRFFSRLVGRSNPWSKKWWLIFWNDGPKHIKLTTVDIWVVYFTYTLTHICIWTADYTLNPVLSGHSKKKTNYCLMQVKSIAECSKGSILQYFWPSLSYHLLLRSLFVFFEWLLRTCFTVLTTYMYFLFCGVRRLAVRWIYLLKWDFFTTKKNGSTGPTALESDWPYFEIMGQLTRAHHKSEGLPLSVHHIHPVQIFFLYNGLRRRNLCQIDTFLARMKTNPILFSGSWRLRW